MGRIPWIPSCSLQRMLSLCELKRPPLHDSHTSVPLQDGVVLPPTPDELAKIVYNLNKGAVSALETLRLIKPRHRKTKTSRPSKGNEKEGEKTFEYMFSIVGGIIPLEHHATLQFNRIMIEHLLCKFSRAQGKNKKCIHIQLYILISRQRLVCSPWYIRTGTIE